MTERPEAAEARLEAILDSIGELFIACDRDWRLTFVNARTERYLGELGRTRRDMIGRRIWEVMPELARSPFHQAAFQAVREHRPVEVEARYEPIDRWFSARIVPSADGAVCHAHDITERKLAEAAARESHELLRAVFDGTGEAIYVKDPEGRYLLVNRGAAAVLGRPVDDIVGRTDADLVDADQAQVFRASDLEVLSTGETRTAEVAVRIGDGVRVHLSTKSLLRGGDGRPAGVVGVSRDITERSRAEAELRRWARIFEHAGWGVLLCSEDGRRVEAVNPAFARIHGYAQGELAGADVTTLVAPESRGQLADQFDAARRLGRHGYESRHQRRDGSAFPVRVDIAPVRGEGGVIEHWALNVQDLTAQRRAEEQVREAQKMEAVGRLAGGLAHDFNNMLMIIIGFSDLLHASLGRGDPRQADAEEIRRAAERASALTQQLLAFGRTSLVPPQPVDLNAIIRGVQGMLRPVVGEHIEVMTGLDAALAPIEGDRGQLEQVLMNLALNARDAMPRGGRLRIETANVEFAAGHAYRTFGVDLPAGRYVMLVVSDSGTGMDRETRARMFEPFFTTKQVGGNSGLGLATVYAIVTRNGGYIWVDSEPGRGTTFTLCFPPAAAEVRRPAPPAPAALRGGTETVLVVEDEAAVRSLASRVLREQGYEVLEAEHGEAALDRILHHEREVRLVISDVIMPVMSGRALGEHLAELRPGLPVLYMSGYTDGEMSQLGVETGAPNFLPKPFAPEALLGRVRELLDRAPVGSGA